MKIKFFSFGRSAVLFTLAVLLAFVFNACSGGAGSAVDDFTADGDYYNNGNGNSPIIVSYPNGTSGTGWVSNGSASTTTKSNASNEGSIIKLNTAKQKAADSQYSAALNLCDEILATDPNYTDAQTLRDLMARILELKELIASKKAELADVIKQIADLDALIAQWEKKVADLKKVMEQKKAAVDAYDLQIADLKGQIAAETDPAKKAQLEAQLAQLEALRESAWQDYLQAKKEYDDAYAYLQELYEKRKQLIARKEALEKEIEALEAEFKAKEKAAKKIQTVKTGTGDYPYTQHWIVKKGTKIYDGYLDIMQYLNENTEYLVTGTINGKKYTEDDELYMKVSYLKNPTNTTSYASQVAYTVKDWNGGSGGYVSVGSSVAASMPSCDISWHPENGNFSLDSYYASHEDWAHGSSVRAYYSSYITDQVRFNFYSADTGEQFEITGEYRNFTYHDQEVVHAFGGKNSAQNDINTYISQMKALDIYKVGTFNGLDIMIYAKDSQVKKPE